MSPALSIVQQADNAVSAVRGETVAQHVRRLQSEARQLAKDHIGSLVQQIADLEVMAAEIAEGGEAYPPGVRDVARRLVMDCEARVQTLEVIVART